MNINDSRPNRSTQDHGIHPPGVVRGIRTLRAGAPATAKAWALCKDTGAILDNSQPNESAQAMGSMPIG
jgi:hypothetical protein